MKSINAIIADKNLNEELDQAEINNQLNSAGNILTEQDEIIADLLSKNLVN